jgi:hypothetical protein
MAAKANGRPVPGAPASYPRRVYKAELRQRTGWSDSWIRELVKRGQIPPGRTDPGGKREFWMDDVADKIVRGERVEQAAA